MNRGIKRVVLIGLYIVLLTACNFAPMYHRPCPPPIPKHYKEAKKQKPTARVLAKTTKDAPWWHMFGDQTLNELEDKLTCANQNLQVAFARYQEARAAAQVARSALYPTIFSIGNAVREQVSKHIANPPQQRDFSDFYLAADLTYELDLWWRVRNYVIASESLAKASCDDISAVSLSLHAELALDYFTLRGDEAAQRVLDATVVAYETALYLTRQRYGGGAAPIADVELAETQLQNAKTLATELRLQRAQLEHAIAVLIGVTPGCFTMPSATSAMKLVSIAPDLPSKLLERRPDIAAAEQRVLAANAEIGVACAAFFPTVNLFAITGFESKKLLNLISKPSLFWSLGPLATIGFTQPLVNLVLWDGGRLCGLLNEAKASYYETVAHYRQTVLNAFQEVEDSLVAIRRLDQEIKSQTAATTAAERALQQAKYRYNGGITNYLDVVVNENLALQAELASVNVRTRRQIASVLLIKALGGGWSMCPRCPKG
jgi:NodT family efflux transporter outer membrane factor (OMF) lipoprotein